MNLKDITMRLIYEFNTSLTLSNKQALPPLVLILELTHFVDGVDGVDGVVDALSFGGFLDGGFF